MILWWPTRRRSLALLFALLTCTGFSLEPTTVRRQPDAALHISISSLGKWSGSAPLWASHTSVILILAPMTKRRPLLTSALLDGQSAKLGAAFRIPNSRRPVVRGRYNAKAIPTEGGTDDPTLMASQATWLGATLGVPYSRRLVPEG